MPGIVDDGEAIGKHEICTGWALSDRIVAGTCLVCGQRSGLETAHAWFRDTVSGKIRAATIAAVAPMCVECEVRYDAGALPIHPNWRRA